MTLACRPTSIHLQAKCNSIIFHSRIAGINCCTNTFHNKVFEWEWYILNSFTSCIYCCGETLLLIYRRFNNRQAIYRTRSEGQNILQYIGCTREAQDKTTNILIYILTPTHHSALQKKERIVEESSNNNTNTTCFGITFHFYFLQRLLS